MFLCLCTTIGLVRVVLAVVVSITDVGRVGADSCATLELTWSAFELRYSNRSQHIINQETQENNLFIMNSCVGFPLTLTAVCRLIRAVTAVVLSITLPPERNALVIFADKLKDQKIKVLPSF